MKQKFVYKDLIIFSMLISFIVLALTGILKYKKLYSFLSISSPNLPLALITTLHELSAFLLIILILIHLIIQRVWFLRFVNNFIKNKRAIYFMLGIILSIILFFVFQYSKDLVKQNNQSGLNQLTAVEVRQYEGENLSSVKDFRENSIKGPQYLDINDYQLSVSGLVEKPLELSYDEVLSLPVYTKVVTLYCVEGWSAKILWEGVLIEDILRQASVAEGANTVIFHAYDGYTSSLPLDYIKDRQIILAVRMNGVGLPPERGFPFQVVAEDKWGYKWVKWVTGIELSDDPDYKGYWESAGYNNNGDWNGPKFEK